MESVVAELCGVLVLDKPAEWTSHDAVNRARRLFDTKRVGHLGTLDPLATGVLPLVIGKATRLSQFYTKDRKAYRSTIRLGQATNSYDRDGEPVGEAVPVNLTEEQIRAALAPFQGAFEQMPPAVSAKKINGVPAYKLARQNKPVELKAVPVEIYRLELLRMEGADIEIEMECTAGTYVRSLAHDLGIALGCGAHVLELRRTSSGEFSIAQAKTLEELAAMKEEGRLNESLLQGNDLLPEIPTELVDTVTEAQIRQGRDFRTSPFRINAAHRLVKAMNREGDLIAIGEQVLPNLYHPVVVL